MKNMIKLFIAAMLVLPAGCGDFYNSNLNNDKSQSQENKSGAPKFSPMPGMDTFNQGDEICLYTDDAEAEIHYYVNGVYRGIYNGPIKLDYTGDTITIKALAKKSGQHDSDETTVVYFAVDRPVYDIKAGPESVVLTNIYSKGATGYFVHWKEIDGNVFTDTDVDEPGWNKSELVGVDDKGFGTYIIKNLVPSRRYAVGISAINECGRSKVRFPLDSVSSGGTEVIHTIMPYIADIENFNVDQTIFQGSPATESIKLHIKHVDGVCRYKIYWKKNGSSGDWSTYDTYLNNQHQLENGDVDHTIWGLTSWTKYEVKVSALSLDGVESKSTGQVIQTTVDGDIYAMISKDGVPYWYLLLLASTLGDFQRVHVSVLDLPEGTVSYRIPNYSVTFTRNYWTLLYHGVWFWWKYSAINQSTGSIMTPIPVTTDDVIIHDDLAQWTAGTFNRFWSVTSDETYGYYITCTIEALNENGEIFTKSLVKYLY